MRAKTLFVGGWAHRRAPKFLLESGESWAYRSIHSFAAEEANGTLSKYAVGLQKTLHEFEEPPVLVAWSMGAMAALEVLRVEPELVSRTVLCGATPCFRSRETFPIGVSGETLLGLYDAIAAGESRPLQRFFSEVRYPEKLRSVEREKLLVDAQTIGYDELAEGVCYLRDFDLRDELLSIRAPITVLHGVKDVVIPIEAASLLSTMIPGAVLRRVLAAVDSHGRGHSEGRRVRPQGRCFQAAHVPLPLPRTR